jgi:hypothetical protein
MIFLFVIVNNYDNSLTVLAYIFKHIVKNRHVCSKSSIKTCICYGCHSNNKNIQKYLTELIRGIFFVQRKCAFFFKHFYHEHI